MGMMCRCTERYKDKSGKITGYKVIIENGRIAKFTPEMIKNVMASGQFVFDNLKLTSDNRVLCDKNVVDIVVESGIPVKSTDCKNTLSDKQLVDAVTNLYIQIIRGFMADGIFEDTGDSIKMGDCLHRNNYTQNGTMEFLWEIDPKAQIPLGTNIFSLALYTIASKSGNLRFKVYAVRDGYNFNFSPTERRLIDIHCDADYTLKDISYKAVKKQAVTVLNKLVAIAKLSKAVKLVINGKLREFGESEFDKLYTFNSDVLNELFKLKSLSTKNNYMIPSEFDKYVLGSDEGVRLYKYMDFSAWVIAHLDEEVIELKEPRVKPITLDIPTSGSGDFGVFSEFGTI